jgi:hypothetical protein
MEFLRKHYEKIILSVVLLGLAVAAALLPMMVSRERSALEELERDIRQTPPKPLKASDLSTNELSLERLQKPSALKLAGEHNLFNPVQWQRRPDGTLFPIRTGKEIGAGALIIAKLSPLFLRIEFDGPTGTPENPQYRFRILREAAKRADQRVPTTRSAPAVGSKNDVFMVKEMKPKDNPTEFVLELVEDKQQVAVTKEKPFSQVAGYLADLRYEPEKLSFIAKRVGDSLVFAGDTNKIVAITETNVTVRATSNDKRTTIPYKPAQ